MEYREANIFIFEMKSCPSVNYFLKEKNKLGKCFPTFETPALKIRSTTWLTVTQTTRDTQVQGTVGLGRKDFVQGHVPISRRPRAPGHTGTRELVTCPPTASLCYRKDTKRTEARGSCAGPRWEVPLPPQSPDIDLEGTMWGPVGSARPIALSRSASSPSHRKQGAIAGAAAASAVWSPRPGLPGAQGDAVGSTGWADPTQQISDPVPSLCSWNVPKPPDARGTEAVGVSDPSHGHTGGGVGAGGAGWPRVPAGLLRCPRERPVAGSSLGPASFPAEAQGWRWAGKAQPVAPTRAPQGRVCPAAPEGQPLGPTATASLLFTVSSRGPPLQKPHTFTRTQRLSFGFAGTQPACGLPMSTAP